MTVHYLRKIDLVKAMRTFVLVIEKQSFSGASRELNLVTSAISKQVSDLEKHYDTQLLYRTTRAMHLTDQGSYYLECFKDILSRLDDLEDIASQRKQRISGHLRISAPLGSGSIGYLQGVSDFVKCYPDVRITWVFTNRFVNIVEEGIDLSIRVGQLEDSNLIARRYSTIRVNFVASPEYLAQNGVPLHPKELSQHCCIVDSSNRKPKRWRYQQKGAQELLPVEAFMQVNDGEVTAQLAAQGHGIALLPTFLTQSYLDAGQLQPILREYEFDASPVSLVYPAIRVMNPTLKALVDFLLENRPDKGQ
jgi:DNA-binding transcriptional LysR family regulator